MLNKGFKTYANTYILKRFDGVMLIDPSFDYKSLKEKVKGLNLLGIILTHGHYNHIKLVNRFNCPIYMHKDDYLTFVDDELSGYNASGEKRIYKIENLDIRFIDEKTELFIIDKKVEIIQTPGHTKGSISIYYDNNLYTGDTLTLNGPGYSKRKGNSRFQLKKSIGKIYELFSINTTVYPGHGEPTTLLEIRQKNNTIKEILKK